MDLSGKALEGREGEHVVALIFLIVLLSHIFFLVVAILLIRFLRGTFGGRSDAIRRGRH